MSYDDDWTDGFRRHCKDWEEYVEMMNHDFVGGFCQKCYTSKDSIDNGKASGFCQGFNPYLPKGDWTAVSPDKPATYDWFKPQQVDPKKCDCSMETLLRIGCSCGGK